MIDGIGSRKPRPLDAPSVDALVSDFGDVGDAGEETPLAALFATVDALEDVAHAAAAARSREAAVEEALMAPPVEHARQAIDLGRITAALARVARRPPRPGESPAESRMRQVAEKYLALRLEVAAGMARIAVG